MILTRDHGAVRELQLDRPPANALSPELVSALAEAVRAAPREGARAIVLSGLPGRFSGGLDVPFLLTVDRAGIAAAWRGFYDMMHTLVASPLPIAAAVTGHAPAGGTVLALLCDWRAVAEGDWKLGLNEVQVGLPLPPVILALLQRQVGPRHAERLAVSGALISPAEALRVGLVDEVVPAAGLVARAVEWCEGLLALPPEAMATTRRQARADLVALLDDAVRGEIEAVEESWFHPETQSVLHAVVERMRQKK
ncbi:MAG TPA: enoyl-CoA hydratase/isomerase family protein [Thermoanaerobaculia bacterium]|nr:enoyl-CoA hydratase/isomerase family protein [Thermoanaerobaculia bacterium]